MAIYRSVVSLGLGALLTFGSCKKQEPTECPPCPEPGIALKDASVSPSPHLQEVIKGFEYSIKYEQDNKIRYGREIHLRPAPFTVVVEFYGHPNDETSYNLAVKATEGEEKKVLFCDYHSRTIDLPDQALTIEIGESEVNAPGCNSWKHWFIDFGTLEHGFSSCSLGGKVLTCHQEITELERVVYTGDGHTTERVPFQKGLQIKVYYGGKRKEEVYVGEPETTKKEYPKAVLGAWQSDTVHTLTFDR